MALAPTWHAAYKEMEHLREVHEADIQQALDDIPPRPIMDQLEMPGYITVPPSSKAAFVEGRCGRPPKAAPEAAPEAAAPRPYARMQEEGGTSTRQETQTV